jgi:large subunit ribosomal protein L23
MNLYDVIKKPLLTEKTTLEKDNKNVAAFVVANDANKIEIKNAVQQLFKVEVIGVHTAVIPGKLKRVGKTTGKRANWKKAYITLKEGCNIDFFEV